MVSLVDIGHLSDKVELRGKEVETQGLSAQVIVSLLQNSMELRMVFAQKKLEAEMMVSLVEQAPLAVAQMIAAGVGKQDDAETIEFAYRQLGAGETFELLKSIFGMTWPKGVKSFVDEVSTLLRSVGERGWAADTKSPGASKSASKPAIPQTAHGDTRPDNSEHGQS
jgi:hypothetical protein